VGDYAMCARSQGSGEFGEGARFTRGKTRPTLLLEGAVSVCLAETPIRISGGARSCLVTFVVYGRRAPIVSAEARGPALSLSWFIGGEHL